jgi:hypothetical protein
MNCRRKQSKYEGGTRCHCSRVMADKHKHDGIAQSSSLGRSSTSTHHQLTPETAVPTSLGFPDCDADRGLGITYDTYRVTYIIGHIQGDAGDTVGSV